MPKGNFGRPHEKLSGNRDLKDKLGLRRPTMRAISILGAGKKACTMVQIGKGHSAHELLSYNKCSVNEHFIITTINVIIKIQSVFPNRVFSSI